MTREMEQMLIKRGVPKISVNTKAAHQIVDALMDDYSREMVDEAKRQVEEQRAITRELKAQYDSINDILVAVTHVEDEYGHIVDEDAKTVVSLYATLLEMNKKACEYKYDGMESIRNASYILYAFLGGQARRDITYNINEE